MTSTPTLRPRTSRDPEPDLTSLLVTHRAIRQDLGRLAGRLAAIGRGYVEPAHARAVCRYTAALLAALRAHHENENDIIWPLIAATARQAVDLAPLADDRLVIDEASGRVQRALARFAADPGAGAAALQASIRELRDLSDEHISDEEAQLLPVMRRYLPAQAYRWGERQIMRRATAPGPRFTVPWLARHARDGELRPLLAGGGWRARVVLAFSRRPYARLERRAFGNRPSKMTHNHEEKAVMTNRYPTAAQKSELERPHPPASLLWAVKAMYAGAVIAAIHAVIYVVTAGAQKTAIEAKHPHMSPSTVNALTTGAVIFEAVVAVLSAVLFVWIARSCLKGRSGARITGTVLFVVAVMLTAYSLGPGAVTTLAAVVIVVVDLIGLAAVVLLWQRSSSAYFTFFKRPQF